MSKDRLSIPLSKISLIPSDLRQKVNASEHKEAILTSLNTVAESMLVATDIVVNSARNNKGGNIQNNITIKNGADNELEKLIDPDIKKAIKDGGHQESVSLILNSFIPKLLKTLEDIDKSEKDHAKLGMVLDDFLYQAQNIKQDKAPTQIIKQVADTQAGTNYVISDDPLATPLIEPEIRAAIIRHPHKEPVVKLLSGFVKKMLPVVKKATEIGGEVAVKAASTAIETTIGGDTGKSVANITTIAIQGTVHSFKSSIDEVQAGSKIIDPDIREMIEEHPHREAVKEFFKLFLPKLLQVLKTIAEAGVSLAATIGMNALEKANPEFYRELRVKDLTDELHIIKKENSINERNSFVYIGNPENVTKNDPIKGLQIAKNSLGMSTRIEAKKAQKDTVSKVTKSEFKQVLKNDFDSEPELPNISKTEARKSFKGFIKSNSKSDITLKEFSISRKDSNKFVKDPFKKFKSDSGDKLSSSKNDLKASSKDSLKKISKNDSYTKLNASKTDLNRPTKDDLKKAVKDPNVDKSSVTTTDYSKITQELSKHFLDPIDLSGVHNLNNSDQE